MKINESLEIEIKRRKIDRKFHADRNAFRNRKREVIPKYQEIVAEYPAWNLFDSRKKYFLNGKFKVAPHRLAPPIASFLEARQVIDRDIDKEFIDFAMAKLSPEETKLLQEKYQIHQDSETNFLKATKKILVSYNVIREFFHRQGMARITSTVRPPLQFSVDKEYSELSVNGIALGSEDTGSIQDDNEEDFDPRDPQEGPSTGPPKATKRSIRHGDPIGREEYLATARNQRSGISVPKKHVKKPEDDNVEEDDLEANQEYFDPRDPQEGPSTGPSRATRRSIRHRKKPENNSVEEGFIETKRKKKFRDQQPDRSPSPIQVVPDEVDNGNDQERPEDGWIIVEAPKEPTDDLNMIESVRLSIIFMKWAKAKRDTVQGRIIYTNDAHREEMQRFLINVDDEQPIIEILEVLEEVLKRGACFSNDGLRDTALLRKIDDYNKLLEESFEDEEPDSPSFEIKRKLDITRYGEMKTLPLTTLVEPYTYELKYTFTSLECSEGEQFGLVLCGVEFDPIQEKFIFSHPPAVEIKMNEQACLPNNSNIEFNKSVLLSVQPKVGEKIDQEIEVTTPGQTSKFLFIRLIQYTLKIEQE